MREVVTANDMSAWIASVRNEFLQTAPDLLPLFEIYAAEAIFARKYITNDLLSLRSGAKILEVGAGSFLLSCQLVREGYAITALEPIGDGFSHFQRMCEIVLKKADLINCQPKIENITAEEFCHLDCYDYAYSINVMEHVQDVERVLLNVTNSLVEGASYRFTCPNYLFPYEPHFNIPTLFSKSLTEMFLGRRILGNQELTDPAGTWRSLNWIDVRKVKRYSRKLPGLHTSFDQSMLTTTLERVAVDPKFASRRSPFMRSIILAIVRLRLHKILALVPATIQPIIDCTIKKLANTGTPSWHR